MEHALGQEFVSVVEKAAIACAHTMGLGDRRYSDQVATESMRKALHEIPMDGTIVIGEGERDEAPMLFIGEKVGDTSGSTGVPVVDIAVDPLEGTNLCATGANNAIAVIAASDQGGLLHAPDCYMEKIIVGPSSRGAIDIDAPVKQNLKAIAKRLDRGVDDVVGTGVHAVMGTGGAPEGVLTAAALRCLNGEMQARLVVAKPDQEKRLKDMGVEDLKKVYTTEELAPGDRMIFAACGVTDGTLLKGVRFFGGGARTHTLIMTLQSRKARFIDTVHLERRPDFKVRF